MPVDKLEPATSQSQVENHCAPIQVHCGMDSLIRTFTASKRYVSSEWFSN